MTLLQLTRSAVLAALLAWLVTFLPGLRTIQAASAAGAPLPLPRHAEPAVLATQDPFGGCVDRTRIVQDCALANLPAIRALEQQAIADLIAIHQVPPGFPSLPAPGEQAAIQGPSDTASRLLSWERDTLRSMLFNKIAPMLEKTPRGRTAEEQATIDALLMLAGKPINTRTAEEQAIADALAARVGQQRLAAATAARRFYDSWRNNPCTFEPPAGASYSPPSDCAIPNALSNVFSNPPSLEQFQAYGAFAASQRFSNDADLAAAAAHWAKLYGFLGGLAAAGVAAAAAYAVASLTGLGAAIAAALLPYAGVIGGAGTAAGFTISTAAATAAGAAAFAAIVVIVVVAVVVAVLAGITIFTASEIPGKLDEAITNAGTPPELYQVFLSEAGKQEVYAAYLLTTFPAADSPTLLGGLTGWAPVPASRPDDQKFLIDPGPAQRESAELEFKGWNGTNRARLSQGWFVDRNGLTLEIDYINHAGEQWTAWRVADRFRHTTVGDTKPSFESDTIQYQDASGANRTARIQSATPAITVTQGPDIVVTAVTVTNPPPTFAPRQFDTVYADQTSADGAVVTYATPAATDDGGNPASVSCTPPSGSTFPVGRTTVTCTATGRFGLTSTTTLTVDVRQTLCNGVQPTIYARPGRVTMGTPGNDVILGLDGPDEIFGGDGDDLICGLGGDDRIFGEGGADSIHGGDGDDLLDGGEGQDELFGGPGNDIMRGGGANDWLEDREGASQTFDGGGGDANRCVGVRTAMPAGTIANCQIRFQ